MQLCLREGHASRKCFADFITAEDMLLAYVHGTNYARHLKQALRVLLTELRPLFGAIPKAKTAKLVRGLIEAISRVPDSTQLQVRQGMRPQNDNCMAATADAVLPAHIAVGRHRAACVAYCSHAAGTLPAHGVSCCHAPHACMQR